MIFELFKLMVKEEVRIHTKLFPSIFFYFFPLVIFSFSFLISIFIFNYSSLFNLFLIFIFLTGVGTGSFSFHMREIYLRRFPSLNFILYSYYSIPIKDEKIFTAFFLKELFFFSFWLFLPLSLGLFQFNLQIILVAFSFFLVGNSASSFLSNNYNKKGIFYLSLILISTFFITSFSFLVRNYFLNFLIFIIFFLLSYKTIDLEYKSKAFRYKNIFRDYLKVFKNYLIAKDFVDLKRSYGIVRIIFSFIFPLILVYFLLKIFQAMNFPINSFSFVSMFIGFLSVAAYDTLVEFDRWELYSILPLRKSDVIRSKLKSSLIISLPLIIITILILTKNLYYLALSIVSMLYLISLVVFIVGLETSLLFDFRRILLFSVLFIPYFFISMIGSPLFLLFLIPSFLLIYFGLRKFD